MDYIFGDIWQLESKFGSGSFGEIFMSRHIETQEESAIKLEPVASKTNQLLKESSILKKLEGIPGIPRVNWYGTKSGFNSLVIQLLGPSLEQLFGACRKKFSMKTVLMIAEQVLSRVQAMHSHGIIHRDIKPENLLIGLAQHANMIHLIDFGLAKNFKTKNGHIPYKENLGFTGNQKFCSANALLGIQQSRRDDLEAIGYMLVYFANGSLPWDSIKSTTKSAKREFITNMKVQNSVKNLCEALPNEFAIYMNYVKSLRFSDKPDYWYLLNLFRNLFIKMNHYYDSHFDWVNHRLYIAAARKRNQRQKSHFQLNVHSCKPNSSTAIPSQASDDCSLL